MQTELKKVMLRMKPEVHTKLKVLAAKREQTMTAFLEELILREARQAGEEQDEPGLPTTELQNINLTT